MSTLAMSSSIHPFVQHGMPTVGLYLPCHQVELPVDKGVVLLDIGFTGADPNHGKTCCST